MGDDMPPDARRALHTVRLTGEVLAAVVRDLLTRRPVVILQDPFYTWETQVLRLPDSAGARLAEAMNAFGLDPTLVTRVDEAVRAFTAWSRTAAAEAFAREAIRQARSDAADEADQERRRSP